MNNPDFFLRALQLIECDHLEKQDHIEFVSKHAAYNNGHGLSILLGIAFISMAGRNNPYEVVTNLFRLDDMELDLEQNMTGFIYSGGFVCVRVACQGGEVEYPCIEMPVDTRAVSKVVHISTQTKAQGIHKESQTRTERPIPIASYINTETTIQRQTPLISKANNRQEQFFQIYKGTNIYKKWRYTDKEPQSDHKMNNLGGKRSLIITGPRKRLQRKTDAQISGEWTVKVKK